ncbi:Inositol 2-dehydrogenase [Clostridium sp. C105KSO15]|nr:Inositol 2-dehydrogenase [Clostridium sp. C105KSO15]
MKNVKIGVISFEHMHAVSYTKALLELPGVELLGIADEDEFRGTRMAYEFKTRYFKDYHDLLNEAVDGVIICTNNKMHCQVSVDAALKGKHIMVEKPFALTAAEARQMIRAADEAGVRIMNAFPMRFNPNIVAAREMVEQGEIGDILSITGINHGKIPSGWFLNKELSGGGGVMDHTVHLADLIRWFTNSEYRSVYCESGDLIHNKQIDDCGIVMAEMESGAFVTIDCSWAHHKNYPIWPQVDMEIIGTKGVLEVKAFGQVNHIVDEVNGIIEDVIWNEGGDEGLVREFVEVCRTGKEPLASGRDGARALEVAVAAYQSTDSHTATMVEHIEFDR